MKGTHQCDLLYFCGCFGSQIKTWSNWGLKGFNHELVLLNVQPELSLPVFLACSPKAKLKIDRRVDIKQPCNIARNCHIVFHPISTYLLGLLAMIKCSICSYQCDNWYVSNWRLACHINFWLGERSLELAQGPQRVALAWHFARSSTPSGVTIYKAHHHLLLNKDLQRAILDCLCINLRLQHPHLQLLHQWWSWKAADWLSIRDSWGAHINKKKKNYHRPGYSCYS